MVTDLIYELFSAVDELPSEDLTPGYRFAPETQVELRRMVLLLQESRGLLRQAIDREIPCYTDFDAQFEARKRRS